MSAPEPAVAWHLLILSSFLPQIFWRPLLLATVPAFPFWSLGDACMRAKSLQSYPTLYDPMDCSSPGWGFSGKNTGLPCPLPGDLPNPGIKPKSLSSPPLAGDFFTSIATCEAPSGESELQICNCYLFIKC